MMSLFLTLWKVACFGAQINSQEIVQMIVSIMFILHKKQFSSLLNRGLGSRVKASFCEYLTQPVFNTPLEVAKTRADEGRENIENIVGHGWEPWSHKAHFQAFTEL